MANSQAHKLGQLVGKEIEAAIRDQLSAIAAEFGLYLDYYGRRPARKRRVKVRWEDEQGSTHDLDYVLEKGGTATHVGDPRAFIETAWRSYGRHSKNKAQEIQGAILPLAQKHRNDKPFLGSVIAGVFTIASVEQMRSAGFTVIHCPHETVVSAFEAAGVNVSLEDTTDEEDIKRRIEAFVRLSPDQKARVRQQIVSLNHEAFSSFFDSLRDNLGRRVQEILVRPVFGADSSFSSVEEAIGFISLHDEGIPAGNFVRYEIQVRFSNGDRIEAELGTRERAVAFLKRQSN